MAINIFISFSKFCLLSVTKTPSKLNDVTKTSF